MRLVEKRDVKTIVSELEEGITDLMNSDRYMNFLKTMTNFHGYSLNNTILIALQNPEASLVAGYKKWQSMGRQVKQGEKAITILCPCPYKKKLTDKENKPVLDENGNPKEISMAYFRPGKVFDISQTTGEELELLMPKALTDSVDGYEDLVQKLIFIAPVPVTFEDVDGGAKGYFSSSKNRIVVKKDMANLQALKTLIHETAHSLLHNKEAMENKKKDRETKEVEAESVAYCVMTSLGLDTSEYSFPYIAGWSSGRELKELKSSLDTIRLTAGYIIDELQEKEKEIA